MTLSVCLLLDPAAGLAPRLRRMMLPPRGNCKRRTARHLTDHSSARRVDLIDHSTQATVQPSDTRTRLILTAMQLFRDKGYGSTSVADVLQAARVNSGSLYHF